MSDLKWCTYSILIFFSFLLHYQLCLFSFCIFNCLVFDNRICFFFLFSVLNVFCYFLGLFCWFHCFGFFDICFFLTIPLNYFSSNKQAAWCVSQKEVVVVCVVRCFLTFSSRRQKECTNAAHKKPPLFICFLGVINDFMAFFKDN